MDKTCHDEAFTFLRACGCDPTPDAVAQLTQVFLPCLRIMCRGRYNPDGEQWRSHGPMGNLFHARHKMGRVWEKHWRRRMPITKGDTQKGDAIDLINYLGFFLRGRKDPDWGSWGEPGD